MWVRVLIAHMSSTRGRRPMKKLAVGATLLTLLGSAAVAQTTLPETTLPEPAPLAQPLPPGLSDLPTGLSNDSAKRDWDTPPGWSNPNSQGWQNGGGPTATAGGPSSMAGGKGRGR